MTQGRGVRLIEGLAGSWQLAKIVIKSCFCRVGRLGGGGGGESPRIEPPDLAWRKASRLQPLYVGDDPIGSKPRCGRGADQADRRENLAV